MVESEELPVSKKFAEIHKKIEKIYEEPEKKVVAALRRIPKIERELKLPSEPIWKKEAIKTPVTKKKPVGTYQAYQAYCNQRLDPNDPDSLSPIELIEGKELHPNERLPQCAILWKKDRTLDDPIEDGIKKRVDFELRKRQIGGKFPLGE